MTQRWARQSWRVVAATVAALLAALWPRVETRPALAHPMDEYLQAAYLTLSSDGVALELDLTPGVLVAPQVIALVDTDGDGQISQAEAQAYARRVLDDVSVEVDQHPYGLVPTTVAFPPMLNLTAGVGVIHLEAALAQDGPPLSLPAGGHQVTLHNGYLPVKSAYQSAVVLPQPSLVRVQQQTRDDLQQTLRVEYGIAPPVVSAPASALPDAPPALGGGLPAPEHAVLDALAAPAQSPSVLVLGLLLSAILGGLHGLTPGHGKALLASYLVGSRGTVRQAVFLGGSITFTHTASVIAVGLGALLAGHFIIPRLLVPALELTSGALVLGLGARLVWVRWRAIRNHQEQPAHHHAHDHTEHAHPHTHAPAAERVGWRDLAMLGVSGGLTPCPEAIGILLIAIGVDRVAVGLGLISAFSVGLAIVLCSLGLLLVRARGLVDRLGTLASPSQRYLPLGSALVVTLLGVGIVTRAVLTYVVFPVSS